MKNSRTLSILLIALFLTIVAYMQSKNLSAPVIHATVESATIPPWPSEHPRLFFGEDEIGTLRAEANSTHEEIWAAIEEYTLSEIGSSAPASPPTDIRTFRIYGSKLIPFTFTCVVGERADVCDLAKRHLLTYAAWDRWTVAGERDLALAHMVFGNAFAYDWLYNRLDDNEREVIRSSLADRTHQLYEASVGDRVDEWNNWWSQSYVQNHYFINHSALGVAGLALLYEDSRAESWVERASERVTRIQYLLDGIGDGTWHEGMSYQTYGLIYLLPFLVSLRQLQGVDLIPHTYLRNYPYWRIYNYLPGSDQHLMAYGNFEWNWGMHNWHNILRFSASEYNDAHAEWMARQLIGDRPSTVFATPWYVSEFLYYEPAVPAQSPAGLPLARSFPDLGAVIWRTGWSEEDVVFGLKTSAYGGRFAYDTFIHEQYPWDPPCADTRCGLNYGHDHDDANTFYLYGNGQWLAPESVGKGNYKTSFHNTLLIDGQGQFRSPGDSVRNPETIAGTDGYLETTANTPSFNYVAADATRRYRQFSDLGDFTRHVLFLRPDLFLMVDNVEATQAHQYEWVAHFGESVAVEGDWIRGNAAGEQILGVGVLAPQTFTTEAGFDGQPFIRLQPATPTPSLRFVNLLYPTDNASWPQRPEATLVADNGQALLARVVRQDGSQQQDDVLLDYGASGSATTVGDYTFDGRVAVVRRVDSQVEQLFVYAAGLLREEATGIDWISATGGHALEIVYKAGTVSVYGPVADGLKLYAPGNPQLLVNGTPWSSYTREGDYLILQVNSDFLPFINEGSLGRHDLVG